MEDGQKGWKSDEQNGFGAQNAELCHRKRQGDELGADPQYTAAAGAQALQGRRAPEIADGLLL